MDVIKWQLNFGSCNFGLKSYLWFQIKLALSARSILKSRVWFLTKLHSVQLPLFFSFSIFIFVWTFISIQLSSINLGVLRFVHPKHYQLKPHPGLRSLSRYWHENITVLDWGTTGTHWDFMDNPRIKIQNWGLRCLRTSCILGCWRCILRMSCRLCSWLW